MHLNTLLSFVSSISLKQSSGENDFLMCAYVSSGAFLRTHQGLFNNRFGNFPGSQQEAYGLAAFCVAVNNQFGLLWSSGNSFLSLAFWHFLRSLGYCDDH